MLKTGVGQDRSGQAGPADYDGAPGGWFHEVAWPVRNLGGEPAGAEPPGSWLVLGDGEAAAGLAAEMGELLGGDGRVAVLGSADDTGALAAALRGIDNVLYAPSGSSAHLDVAAAYRNFHIVRRLAAALASRKLFILTRNAQPIQAGDRANPAHAILWGLGRTLALEHPESWGAVIDVDDALPPELAAPYLRAEVQAGDGEDQVVYRSGARHVPRLRRWNPPAAPAEPLGDGSQLVIGATGNLGPHLIRQLSAMGAKTVVAVSRRGTGLRELTASLASSGTTLIEVAADAADEAAMAALFGRFGTDLPQLDGIWLAALAGGPVLLDEMTDDQVRAMFRPKLDAVSILHRLSLKTPVRQFVVFSSITSVIGSRWLAHYTAAGAFLDTFGYARRALGLPATVIDWGLWQSAEDRQPSATDVGLRPMRAEVAIRALPTLTGPHSAARSAVVAADWNQLAAAYRMRGALRVVDELLADQTPKPRPHTLLGEPTAPDANTATRSWQALLAPEDKPYPGSHRIHGVDVVPVSVLLATLSAVGAETGPAAWSDVRFEHPIVVDQPRLIQVRADGEALTVSSNPVADSAAPPVIHLSARLARRPRDDGPDGPVPGGDHEIRDYDTETLAGLQRAFGIDGQPFPWTIRSCRSGPDGLRAEVELEEASTAALVDAAVHVARLADSSDQRLMFPASAEEVRFSDGLGDGRGSVEVRRRPGDDDSLVVDIVVKAADGSACVGVRSLRYQAVETAPASLASKRQPEPLAIAELTPAALLGELEVRLGAMLARELGMPASAVGKDRPFPELGLDSMMAMNLLRDAKQLVGIDLSATMLWDHPTVSSLSACIVDLLAPQLSPEDDRRADQAGHSGGRTASTGSLLDKLFDRVESATAGSEGGIR